MNKEAGIFKIQRSLFPPDADCLVYNEDRSVQGQFPVTKEMRDFMGDDMKVYVRGVWRKKDGKLEIDERLEDQNW